MNTDPEIKNTAEDPANEEKPTGKFYQTLIRNNKDIKNDRALSIVEDAEIFYKREIEDVQAQLKKLRREMNNMIDLSPASKNDLSFSSFDGKRFVAEHLAIGLQIRNLEIKLEILQTGYASLFA
jgi:hypothetical protein